MNYIPPAAWPHIPDLIRPLGLTCVVLCQPKHSTEPSLDIHLSI